MEWLPNVALWAAPVLTLTVSDGGKPVVFYRLSADVVRWLEVAGVALESAYVAGRCSREQIEEYWRAMEVVWAFAGEHLDAEAVSRARGQEPRLPEYVTPEEL